MGSNGKLLDPMIAHLVDLAAVHRPKGICIVAPPLYGNIVRNGLGKEQALGHTVTGQIANAILDTVLDGMYFHLLTLDEDLTGIGGVIAKERLRQLSAPRAQQPCNAYNLTLLQGEIDILEAIGKAEILDLQHGRCIFLFVLETAGYNLPARHIIGEFILVQILGAARGHILAVAEDCKALGNLKHLVQLVRNKENGNTLGLELLDELEQGLDLPLGNSGGRLIHDDELGIIEERPADGNHLPRAKGEVFHGFVQIYLQPKLGHGSLGNLLHALLADDFPPGSHLHVKGQIFPHRQVRKQGQILIDDLYAVGNGQLRRHALIFLSIYFDSPRIRRIKAGYDIDNG